MLSLSRTFLTEEMPGFTEAVRIFAKIVHFSQTFCRVHVYRQISVIQQTFTVVKYEKSLKFYEKRDCFFLAATCALWPIRSRVY